MKSSPIYTYVSVSGRTNRDFGAYDGFSQRVNVGTSATNSHAFVDIDVQRKANDDGTVTFSLFVDGVMLKCGTLDGKEFKMTHDRVPS